VNFGELLKGVLNDKKISNKWLALDTGISESTISKFLSGEQEPKFSVVLRILKSLEIPPSVFFEQAIMRPVDFNPIINEFGMVRPLFYDVNTNMAALSVFAFKDCQFNGIAEVVSSDPLYVLYIKSGRITRQRIFNAGDFLIVDKNTNVSPAVLMDEGTHCNIVLMKGSFVTNAAATIASGLLPV
jgi:transcriptional regulator with XRE-family HTH domain